MDHSFENGIPHRWTTIDNMIIDDVTHFDGLEKLTYIVALRHAFEIGKETWPSQQTLAQKVGCTDRTIRNHLKNLSEKGFLEKIGRNEKTDTIKWRVLLPMSLYEEHTKKELENLAEERPSKENKEDSPPYAEIIDYLNEKASKKFKHTSKATQRKIRARWNDGFGLDDFKRVIDNKTRDWLASGTMNEYLRPETLFGTKFESYLNAGKTSKQPNFENMNQSNYESNKQPNFENRKLTDDDLEEIERMKADLGLDDVI